MIRWWTLAAMLLILGPVAWTTSSCATGAETKKEEADKNAEFHYKMGSGYFESQEIALAIRELSAAIEKNPEHYKAHHLLGFIYMGRRDYSKATRHFNEALRLKPEFYVARNNLGAAYLSMERWRDAAEQFEMLLEQPLYPTPELAHNNLGWALYNLRRYKKAQEHFKMAVFLKPGMCLAHNNLGLTSLTLGRHSTAFDAFQEAVRHCPDNYAEPHFHLGKLMQAQGNPRARDHFERCVRLEPSTNLGRRCREYLSVR